MKAYKINTNKSPIQIKLYSGHMEIVTALADYLNNNVIEVIEVRFKEDRRTADIYVKRVAEQKLLEGIESFFNTMKND